MTYNSQADLARDMVFTQRWQACTNEQALVFRNDARPEFVALADKVLSGDPFTFGVWQRVLCASPDFKDARPEQILDAQILAAVQAQWPTVAEIVSTP